VLRLATETAALIAIDLTLPRAAASAVPLAADLGTTTVSS
jgi:hypothetical protein